MTTLQETLTSAIQEGYYRTSDRPNQYIRFISFGSIRALADVFDKYGNGIRFNELLLIDAKEERKKYELVPDEELPEVLKSKQSQLEASAQSQPKCTEKTDHQKKIKKTHHHIQMYL